MTIRDYKYAFLSDCVMMTAMVWPQYRTVSVLTPASTTRAIVRYLRSRNILRMDLESMFRSDGFVVSTVGT